MKEKPPQIVTTSPRTNAYGNLSPKASMRSGPRLGLPSPKNSTWMASIESASAIYQMEKPKEWLLRFPLKFVIIISLCFFTVIPALTLWLLSWQAGADGLDTMQKLGQSSLEDVSLQLRSLLISKASDSVSKVIDASEVAMNHTLHRIAGDGSLEINGSNATAAVTDHLMPHTIFTLKANPMMSMMLIGLYTNMTISAVDGLPNSIFESYTYANLGWDITTNLFRPTIYFARSVMREPWRNETTLIFYTVDQNTGVPSFTLKDAPDGFLNNITVNLSAPAQCWWYDHIVFNTQLGIPQILLDCQTPFNDNLAAYDVTIYSNMYTMSGFLRSLLSGPKERLFVSFRNAMGDLIGASHGKYFSHSDVDYTTNNPLFNPPKVEEFQKFTALNSTDATIQQAARWMIQLYGGWGVIPEFNDVPSLNGELYWMASKHITSSFDLRLQVYLLVDRESRMGPIERTKEKTLADIRNTNNKLVIILICVVVGALIFALVISILLTRSLGQLAFGMDMLSMLEFDEHMRSLLDSSSRFTEVNKCEVSFFALERGLRAFIKYVPGDVVKMMLSGEMESEQIMTRRILTILFMDIAGFSSMCEKIPPDALNKMTMEYLQSMCEAIVSSGGTLDKFIGDCIMAMWNAPHRLKHHESAACGAALEMQSRLMGLCEQWAEEDLPEIRFRIGMNTDHVLVGNFGCDYRISYTCLGDGVNLASRLEAGNKPFGTVVLMTENTKNHAGSHYSYRKIGHITVPGKAQIVAIYELLYQNRQRAMSTYQENPSDITGARTSRTTKTARTVLPATNSLTEPPALDDHFAFAEEILFHWEKVSRKSVDEMTAAYEKGVAHFLMGELDVAEKYFIDARHILPNDGACKLLIEQCRRGKDVNKNWDGVIRFDKKED